jgi:hypothetical protein
LTAEGTWLFLAILTQNLTQNQKKKKNRLPPDAEVSAAEMVLQKEFEGRAKSSLALSYSLPRRFRTHRKVRWVGIPVLPPKTALSFLYPYPCLYFKRSALQKGLLGHFSEPALCRIQPNGPCSAFFRK